MNGSTTAQLEALIRRNAASCEEAQRPVCKCHCAGALHGKHHSEEWVQNTVAQVVDERWAEEE